MEFVRALALALYENEKFHGKWPEGCDQVTHNSNYEVEFEGTVAGTYTRWGREDTYPHTVEIEGYGLPYIEEYAEGETVTREEYEQFLLDNPNFYQETMKARQRNVAKIAELNKQVGALINEMSRLATEAGIDLEIDLGHFGSIDPNGDWDSSRC